MKLLSLFSGIGAFEKAGLNDPPFLVLHSTKTIRGTGHMVFNWQMWEKDSKDIPKIHPVQKPVNVLKKLIETFTDEGDVIIDPCAGSGSTGRACQELNRNFYGFEISKEFYTRAVNEMLIYEPSPPMTIDELVV